MTNQLPILSLPVFWTPWQVQVGISLALLALTMAKEALFKRHYSALNANILQTAIGTLVLIWYMTALLLPFMFYSSAREHRP